MLDRICDELLRAIEAQDADATLGAVQRLWEAAERGDSAALTPDRRNDHPDALPR
ncbi:hypothetical protein ACQP1K_07730 [Sphaerimonospora sp. CA-214678]|uniref:hypothetical protein n=1 Tax=Sphaerimonospora sp. CA-214678 TaxID=3240029 RepID=UPI003D91DD2B